MRGSHATALKALLAYYEREEVGQICTLYYPFHREWKEWLTIWLSAGLIHRLPHYAETVICSGCGDVKRAQEEKGRLFYQCIACDNTCDVTSEEAALYAIGMEGMAGLLQQLFAIEAKSEILRADRLIKLGKRRFNSGIYNIYLGRRITEEWKDREEILEQCKPRLHAENSLVISVGEGLPACLETRMAVLALEDALLEDQGILLVDEEALADALRFTYKGAKGKANKKANEREAAEWLRGEWEAGRVRKGQKEIITADLRRKFGIGRDRVFEIWNEIIPEDAEARKVGRPSI